MKRPRPTVVCEPFTLDRAQKLAMVDAIADVIADEMIREREEREASSTREAP